MDSTLSGSEVNCRIILYGTDGRPNVVDYRHHISFTNIRPILDRLDNLRIDINDELCYLRGTSISLNPLFQVTSDFVTVCQCSNTIFGLCSSSSDYVHLCQRIMTIGQHYLKCWSYLALLPTLDHTGMEDASKIIQGDYQSQTSILPTQRTVGFLTMP